MIIQHTQAPRWFQRHINLIVRSVRKGKCCVVTGGVDRGKSRIMGLVADQLKQSGLYNVLYHKLPYFDTSRSDRFFKDLSRSALKELHTLKFERAQDRLAYTNLIVNIVRASPKNVVYIVDNLQLAPPNLASDLLGALLTAIKQTSTELGSRLIVILCGTLDLNELVRGNVSSFERFSERVVIDDLNEAEAVALVEDECQKYNITPTESGVQALFAQTHYDYALINMLLPTIGADLTPQTVHQAVERLITAFDPNDMHPFHYFRRSKTLVDITLKLLDSKSADWKTSSGDDPAQLCGLFQISEDRIQIKAELWKRLLQRHLTAGQIGRYYAMHSEWSSAIHYMGVGLHQDATCTRDELFRTVITAMYASDDLSAAQRHNRADWFLTPRALTYFAEGLSALYPDCNPHIYSPDFRQLYPSAKHKLKIRREELEDALTGPDFSVSHNRSLLLIPLRLHETQKRVLGVIALDRLLNTAILSNPFQAWLQREELIAFIRQATAALTTKTHEIESVMATQYFASRVDALFGILSEVLMRQKTPEDVLLRLAVHAISSSLGLGFNRVIIMMPEMRVGRERLRVCVAIEEDGAKKPFLSMDALVDRVLDGYWMETPLHHDLEGYEIPVSGFTGTLSSHVGLERAIIDVYRAGMPKLLRQHEVRQQTSSRLYRALEPTTDYAVLPLRAENILGVIYVDNKFSRKPISEELLTVLQTFVRQVAFAIENTRTLEQKQREVSSLNSLLEVMEATSRQAMQPVQILVDTIARKAAELVGADSAVIFSFNQMLPDTQIFAQYPAASDVYDSSDLRRWVVANGVRIVNDVENVSDVLTPDGVEMIHSSSFIQEHQVKGFIGLRLGDPENIYGVLYVNWRRANMVDDDKRDTLQVYAEFAAQAIKNAFQMKKLRERHDDVRALMSDPTRTEKQEIERADAEIKNALKKVAPETRARHVYFILKEPNNRWRFYHFTFPGMVHVYEDLPLVAPVLEAFKQNRAASAQYTGELRGYHHQSGSGIAFPLRSQGNCIAALYIEGDRLPYYSLEEEPDFIKDFDASIRSIERVDNTRVSRAQHLILQQLTDDINSQALLENLFTSVTEAMMRASRSVDAVSLYYFDRLSGKLRLGGLQGFLHETQHRDDWQGEAVGIGYVLASAEQIITATADDNAIVLENKVALREGFVASAAIPLKVKGRHVGCVYFNYRYAHTFSDAEQDQMKMLAEIATIAIYQALLYDIAIRLSDIATKINESLEPDEVFGALLSQVRSITRADNVCIVERQGDELLVNPVNFQPDPATGVPFYHVDNPPPTGQPFRVLMKQNTGLAGRAIEDEETCYIRDTRELKGQPYIPLNHSTRSEIAVPIKSGGRTHAAIALESDTPNFFHQDDIRRVELLASYAGIAMQNAERYKEARRRLALNLLHDLRNSSAVLPDDVDWAMEQLEDSDGRIPILENIKRHALNVSRIIRGIAYFIEDHRFKREKVPLIELLNETIEYASYEIPKNVALSPHYDRVKAVVRGDRIWLRHTIDNILLNAFTAIERKSSDASGKVKLTTRLSSDRYFVEIFVTDSGGGIEKKEGSLDYIFNPGYTTNSRLRFLSGFGLSACKQIIHDHGGSLRVFSRVGQGTTFVIRLPVIGFEE